MKILGKDLEKTLAGLPLLVAYKEDEIPVLKVSYLFFSPLNSKSSVGVSAGHMLVMINEVGTCVSVVKPYLVAHSKQLMLLDYFSWHRPVSECK